MTPTEYLNKVLVTGSKIDSLDYIKLGIMEESGEIAGKIKRLYRGDYSEEVFKGQIAKELGDLTWYLTLYAYKQGQPIAHYRLPRQHNMMDSFYNIEILKIHLLKSSNSKQQTVIINTMIGSVIDLANNCGYSMDQITDMNINKTLGRLQRNKIRGVGDER